MGAAIERPIKGTLNTNSNSQALIWHIPDDSRLIGTLINEAF